MADKNDIFRSYMDNITKKISLKTSAVLDSLIDAFHAARMISDLEKVEFQKKGGYSGASQLITAVHQHVNGDKDEKTYRTSRALKILEENIPDIVTVSKQMREEYDPVDRISIPDYTPKENTDGATYNIFLSFKWGEGDDLVEHLLEYLNGNAGLHAWKDDHEIKVGQSIPDKINEGLEPCSLFVCLMSPNYFESGWCKGEFEKALDKDKTLFPVQWKDDQNFRFQYPADILAKYPRLVDRRGFNEIIANQNPLRCVYDKNAVNIKAEKKRCASKLMEAINS